MKRKRAAGILFHPTSLPGPYGIGDMGHEAFEFADFLAAAGAELWQVLPLGPTGYGNSPYSSRSSFAGNELLISPEVLVDDGFLNLETLDECPAFPKDKIDFSIVETWKYKLLHKAAGNFLEMIDKQGNKELQKDFADFCLRHIYWLNDYALYMSMCDEFQDSRWYEVWDRDIGFRDPKAIEFWTKKKEMEIRERKVMQYFFFSQWKRLRKYVNDLGIELIGDIPIFTASDSADTWAKLYLFKIDQDRAFAKVSGVPPDFFSDTGQLWGTPVYNWEASREEGFSWWLKRIDASLLLADIVRIDH
nr:4-alpha-glucanotransferase [Spirochaetales bacterium]